MEFLHIGHFLMSRKVRLPSSSCIGERLNNTLTHELQIMWPQFLMTRAFARWSRQTGHRLQSHTRWDGACTFSTFWNWKRKKKNFMNEVYYYDKTKQLPWNNWKCFPFCCCSCGQWNKLCRLTGLTEFKWMKKVQRIPTFHSILF